jgi:hypothetical protein
VINKRLRFVVDLACHNTNHFVLVEGLRSRSGPVAKRRVRAGENPVTAAWT